MQKPGAIVENVSQSLQFGSGVEHMNQVISYDRVVYFGYIFEESGMLKSKPSVTTSMNLKPKLSFG